MKGHNHVKSVSESESLCATSIQGLGGRVPLTLEHSQYKLSDIMSLIVSGGDAWIQILCLVMEVRKCVLWPHSKYILSEEFKYR